jgi:competence protein ComEC
MVAIAVAVVIAVWSARPLLCLPLAGAVALAARSVRVGVFTVALVVVAGVRSDSAWASLQPDHLGTYHGWVMVVDDPAPSGSATRVIVEIEGERFEMWMRGRARQLRATSWRAGEWLDVTGERRDLDPSRARRVAWQHIVGRFDVEWAGDVAPGGPLARLSNAVRITIERGSGAIPAPHDALFRGLVMGDDRQQPPSMVQRFRASGLSHLTAVSGQNIAFLLAAAGPVLTRLGPIPRWMATVGLIGWFVVLTRFEPSIIRAGVMACLSATAFVRGSERSALRLLALAVIVLALVDPLLVWSIGFWLSVGATAGVCTLGAWLAARLSVLGPLAVPVGVTLGAQAGVALPSLLVFGRLPVVSIAANVLAVPVAGGVMLYGLPAGIVSGLVPGLGSVLMLPARAGTRWIDTVALLGARLEPGPPWTWWGWAAILVVVASICLCSRRR